MTTEKTINTLHAEYLQIEQRIETLRKRQQDILQQIVELKTEAEVVPTPETVSQPEVSQTKTYAQRVKDLASQFFGRTIKTKAELKRAILNHSSTSFMQAVSMQQSGRGFYDAAEAQIRRLMVLDTPAPEKKEEEEEEEVVEMATVEQLQNASRGQLRGLARWHKLDDSASSSTLISHLHGKVTVWEMRTISAPVPA